MLAARDGDSVGARAALEALCAAYWQPLYGFARRSGFSPEDAADLTQGYFTLFLEKQFLASVRPGAGRFRAFLLASMRNFLANEWDRRNATKRAGDFCALSLDFLVAERRFAAEQAVERSPEAEYELRFALSVVERALAALEREELADGRGASYPLLSTFLTEDAESRYREIGRRLGTSEAAVKSAVHRLRRRFGEKLRAEVGALVEGAEEVDDELRHLLRLLAAKVH